MSIFKILSVGGLALGLAMATGACSDDSGSSSSSSDGGSGASGGSGATGGSGGSGASGGAGGGESCDGPGYDWPGVSEAIGIISGNVVDTNGTPVGELLADVCGTNICLEGKTNASGDFNTDGGDTMLDDVKLILGTGHGYVAMTGPIPNAAGHDFGTIHTVAFPPFSQGVAIAAGADASMGGATLGVPAGATIKFDKILYSEDSQHVFRAVVFDPTDANFNFHAIPSDIKLAVGTSPLNTELCPAAKLTVDNTVGFAANAELELMYHGASILTDYSSYGGWEKVADAVVSADGMTISTVDGDGVNELGLFGFREK